jgi:hypothetical protein
MRQTTESLQKFLKSLAEFHKRKEWSPKGWDKYTLLNFVFFQGVNCIQEKDYPIELA